MKGRDVEFSKAQLGLFEKSSKAIEVGQNVTVEEAYRKGRALLKRLNLKSKAAKTKAD